MRSQELNLLMVFDAIMTEQSITRAAERLAMTQPAVSNAVSRMRTVWKDELFVRDGRNIQPTIYAQNLWRQIKLPLNQLADAVDPQEFDPATATRAFRIALADFFVDILWSPLRHIIEQQAPGIDLHAMPYDMKVTDHLLEDGQADMVIGKITGVPAVNLRAEQIMAPSYVVAMRADHALAKGNLTLEQFSAAEHLQVSITGELTNYCDVALMQSGFHRRVACTVNHFSAIPALLKNSNLIAVVPTACVEQELIRGELAASSIPMEFPASHIACLWHKRQDRDGGLAWLRGHIKAIAEQEGERHQQVMRQFCRQCQASKTQLKVAG